MSTTAYTIALVCATGVALLLIVLVRRGRARRRSEAARRAAAVGRLAESLERVAHELEWSPSPASTLLTDAVGAADPVPARSVGPTDPATGLPTRAALVDALIHDVASTRSAGGRLGLALVDVEASGTGLEPAMAEAARAARAAAPEGSTFRSGERSLTLVLPAAGRADAMAAAARIEASLAGAPPVRTSAVELEADEDAAALLARLATVGR